MTSIRVLGVVIRKFEKAESIVEIFVDLGGFDRRVCAQNMVTIGIGVHRSQVMLRLGRLHWGLTGGQLHTLGCC